MYSDLATSARNITSQHGEDGIIEKIFSVIGNRNRWCVEFGAWDGKQYRNTHHLIASNDWYVVLIEADPHRYRELKTTYADNKKAICLNHLVQFSGVESLDSILARTEVPGDFDLLSIDIDGNDYHIWASLQHFSPRVVVIEYNPTIQNDVEFVQVADMNVNQGSSLLAMTRLANTKGYELVAATDSNAFFVRRELYPELGIENNTPEHIFPDKKKYEMRLFQLYDGTLVVRGCNRLLWNGLKIDPEKIQILPPRERIFGDTRSHTSQAAFSALVYRLGRFAKRTARQFLPAALIAYRARHINERNDYRRWISNGRPVPPPHIVKQHIVAWYRNASPENRILIETGTFRGDMIAAMRRKFEKIVSIELSPELHAEAVGRFARFPRITILPGDSAKVLPHVLASLKRPAIFWLDGHYTRGAVRGDVTTPISEEIAVVLKHPTRGHVILIDDARLFNGSDDYPSLPEFLSEIKKAAPHLHVRVLNDVIRISSESLHPPF